MWWIIGCLVCLASLIFFWAILASGARHDELTHDAFIKMMQEENKTWQYDLTETTTSGSPVELPLDKSL